MSRFPPYIRNVHLFYCGVTSAHEPPATTITGGVDSMAPSLQEYIAKAQELASLVRHKLGLVLLEDINISCQG